MATTQLTTRSCWKSSPPVAESARTAYFACALALAYEGQIIFQAEGRVTGKILRTERGEGGFGYDPLFVPDSRPELAFISDGRTFAELSSQVKNTISHRAAAMKNLAEWLSNQNHVTNFTPNFA